jgi:hypothetical protein
MQHLGEFENGFLDKGMMVVFNPHFISMQTIIVVLPRDKSTVKFIENENETTDLLLAQT